MADSRLCSVQDCGKPASSRGWCKNHWQRWRRYGDPLAGKASKGEPLRFLQDVVMHHTGDDCIRWPYANSSGYGQIIFKGKRQRVNRIICEMVHGPAPTSEHFATHSCGKGAEGCCSPQHLRWGTQKENMADAKEHGTLCTGERLWMSKLTEDAVRQIRAMKGVLTQDEVASRFGISQPTVSQIQSGKIWVNVE